MRYFVLPLLKTGPTTPSTATHWSDSLYRCTKALDTHIAYLYTFNYMIFRPMKSRVDAYMADIFTSIYDYLEKTGHKRKHHVLDNTCFHAV